jgi:hypothetical protein
MSPRHAPVRADRTEALQYWRKTHGRLANLRVR